MFIAKNEHNEIIEIEEATKGNDYYCPECKGKLRVRDGEINVKHFAHESNCDCDNWGEMSEWHLEWQRKFDKSVREIVLQKDDKKHRADIHMSVKGINLTIEFQKSPINKATIRERVNFYSQFGKLLWIFDLRGKDITFDEKKYNRLYKFNWNYPSKSILTPKEFSSHNTIVCFQYSNNKFIIPCAVEKDSWKQFYCRKNDFIEHENLLQWIKDEYFLKPFDRCKFNSEFVAPKKRYQSEYNDNGVITHSRNFILTDTQKELIGLGALTYDELYKSKYR